MTDDQLDLELMRLHPQIQCGDVAAIGKALKNSARRIDSLVNAQIQDGVRRAFKREIASLVGVLKETLTDEEMARVRDAISQITSDS
jgi:hypothetical protein